jgi:hypothetical protein
MNAIRNQQEDAQWALIAQLLKPCTPQLQLALIEQMGNWELKCKGGAQTLLAIPLLFLLLLGLRNRFRLK